MRRHFERGTTWGWVELVIVFALLVLTLMRTDAEAFWDDQPTENTSMIFSAAGQNGNNTLAFSLLEPIPSGWLGLYAARQSANGEIVSETVAAHLQGGFDVGDIGVEAYVTALRDKWQMIDLSIETGYFLRSPSIAVGQIELSGGAGNYTERRDNDDEIGRDAGDASTTFGWLAFITGRLKTRFGEVSSTIRYKPSLDFETTRVEILGALNKEISDTWQFGVSALSQFDSASIVESDFHTSYLVQFTFTPEEN